MNGETGLQFSFDWEPAAGVQSPELRATWARLEVWVGDDCVSQVEDAESRTVRRSIYVPLYPLAEWIAYSWWFLKAHARPAVLQPWFASPRGAGRTMNRWLQHHNMRAAGDGFLWPNLTIVPKGRFTRLVWYQDDEASQERPIRFIRQGEALLDGAAVERSLAGLVEDVIARLDEQHVHETALVNEWRALRQN